MPATSAGMTWRDWRSAHYSGFMNSPCNRQDKPSRSRRLRSRPSRAAARLVRPPSPQAAVAAAGGRAGRSVPGVAVGNHAAADRRQNRRAVFREISGALARGRGARPRLARRRAADVGRARLLFPRPQSARLRGGGAARSRRRVSRYRGGLALAAGDRALYRRGDSGDRLRPPHHAGRRQYRARGVAAVRGGRAAAAGKAADPAIGGDAARRQRTIGDENLAPATARRR